MKNIFIVLLISFLGNSLLFSEESNREITWAKRVVSVSDVINYSPSIEILGKPSVLSTIGKSPCAWEIKYNDNMVQWIELDFDEVENPKSVLIHENYNPGAITNISYFKNGKEEIFYQNNNPSPISQDGRVLKILLPPDISKLSKLKIYFTFYQYKISNDKGLLYQIDAVGISKDTLDYTVEVNESDFETEYFPKRLNDEINSEYIELAPVISSTGRYLFFSRDGDPNNYGSKNQDIYVAENDGNGKFTYVKNIGAPLNNKNSNYVVSVLPDENQLIVGNIYLDNEKSREGFSISSRSGDKWTLPKALKFEKYENYITKGTFCVGPTGNVMISSIKYDSCRGKTDLYVSFFRKDSVWTEPIRMGDVINTGGSEITPHIAPDNKTLYFSTDGLPGYGRHDIFVTHRLDDTWKKWSEPENLGYKINSDGWDAFYTITASGGDVYYVSTVATRNTDIFTLKMKDGSSRYIAPVTLVSGVVRNVKTNEPIGAKIDYEELPSGKKVGSALANAITGEFKITLPAGKKYSILANSENMVGIAKSVDLTDQKEFTEIELDLELVPIENLQTVRMNNIFFDFAEYTLLESSYPELNRVVKFLEDNPNIKIVIMGHTDVVGSDEDNYILSVNRAKAVYNYLIEKGILVERLEVKGFGKTKPVATNETAEGRQLNRRVEFQIFMKNN